MTTEVMVVVVIYPREIFTETIQNVINFSIYILSPLHSHTQTCILSIWQAQKSWFTWWEVLGIALGMASIKYSSRIPRAAYAQTVFATSGGSNVGRKQGQPPNGEKVETSGPYFGA
jgi:hypothetical protein